MPAPIVVVWFRGDLRLADHRHWREGERWFMRRLRDGDPAVTTGNWQWVASTGADALPAFRIFNPWCRAGASTRPAPTCGGGFRSWRRCPTRTEVDLIA